MQYVDEIIQKLKSQNPNENEFHQAAEEVLGTLRPLLEVEKKYQDYGILERLVVPDREIHFRVTWVDDAGKIQVNRG